MIEEVESARFKLTPGFDIETGASLSATSRIAHAFDLGGIRINNPWHAFAVFDGKGEWSSAADAKNHAEAALSPTVAYLFQTGIPFAVGLTADLRSRWGTFEEGEGDQKKTVEGNQIVAGAGFTVLVPSPPSWLEGVELTAAYYQVIDSEGDLSAPETLDVDHLQARLKSRLLPFVNFKPLKSVALVVDGRASRALQGPDEGDFEYYTSLALEVGSKKTAATVRWESGKEVGFKYDEKLVLGVLLRLLGVGRGGS
jgi:hypothetical protein